ncbi:LysR substrate-binding domain-containing protein [Sulfurimonas sp.]
MTLRELELFYYLTENPHVSQLSKKIGISQSAISLAIKSLEKKLGEPLFDRIGKKLVLNERGRFFKEKTHKHYLALKDAQLMFTQNTLFGTLKIASSKTIGEFIMPQIFFDFLSQYPNTSIIKDIKNSTQIIQMLLDGEIDMGIIEIETNEPHIIKEKLGSDKLIIVTSDKKLANKNLFIDQLFYKKWILREKGSGTREIFLDSLGSNAQEIELFMKFTEFEEIKTLLKYNNDIITCLSKFVVTDELQREELFEVIPKNINLQRNLYLVYNKNKYKTNLFSLFQKHLKNNFHIEESLP